MCSSPTRGVSTTDSVFPLLAQANRRPTLVVFLDLDEAFELANSLHAILIALVEKGVRGKLLAWVKDYLPRRARVKFQGVRWIPYELENARGPALPRGHHM